MYLAVPGFPLCCTPDSIVSHFPSKPNHQLESQTWQPKPHKRLLIFQRHTRQPYMTSLEQYPRKLWSSIRQTQGQEMCLFDSLTLEYAIPTWESWRTHGVGVSSSHCLMFDPNRLISTLSHATRTNWRSRGGGSSPQAWSRFRSSKSRRSRWHQGE